MRIVNLLKTTKKWLTFLTLFFNTASNRKLPCKKSLPQNRDISEIVDHAVKNFQNHGSIVAIKNNFVKHFKNLQNVLLL